jgi:hypothetical protein
MRRRMSEWKRGEEMAGQVELLGDRKTSFSRIPVLFFYVLKDTHLRLKKCQKTCNSIDEHCGSNCIWCLKAQVVIYVN